MNFAAIDIGSNAVRLLFSNVIESKGVVHFNKSSLVRMPVRLGSDSFVNNRISDKRKQELIKTLKAYKLLIDVFGVEDYMACATSALREAENGQQVVEEARLESGINVRVIDGNEEAELIHSTHIAETMSDIHSYLYIDVGGGSTELTCFSHGKRLAAESFRIGTVRMLEGLVEESEWNRMRNWIEENSLPDLSAIGTGGNINKIFKLTGKKDGKPVYAKSIQHYVSYLKSFTLEERISELGMRPDRADVIVPAAEIYLQVMKWAHIREMYVPKVGLADGMIRKLYEQHQQRHQEPMPYLNA